MWSEYNPETVKIVEEFHGSALPKFSNHGGVWRSFGFGMYAMSGSDAVSLSLDETFHGWGGEDKNFYDLVSTKLNIIRMHDHGLLHRWHPKECKVGEFVKPEFYPSW